ncbi:MAG: hypothetical protein LBL58_06310 [Tannerellaceae bacterium]|nr:hypothetical protein [Tannerellaceae bacterium]
MERQRVFILCLMPAGACGVHGQVLIGPGNKNLHTGAVLELKSDGNRAGLYASGLLDIMDYINDMDEAISMEDTLAFRQIKVYFHRQMDWKTLYMSGRLWQLVLFIIPVYSKRRFFTRKISI